MELENKQKMKIMKKKKLITIGGMILIIGVSAWFFQSCNAKTKINWQLAVAGRSSMSDMVSATGTVEPVTKVEVGTQVSGIIDKIYVDYNSVETATYNYEKAKSTYEKSQADIIKVRRNLGYAVITSPIDGVVVSREVEEGQTVAAGFETPTLFTIAKDLTEMQVVADVDEADIGQVEEGQRVTFSVDAYPNEVFEGRVTQVRLEATVESNVVTYEVVISAPNPDLKLKPGLTATVSIYTLEKNNVLTIPPKALRFVPDEQLASQNGFSLNPIQVENTALQKTVWVKNGNALEQKEVQTGTSTTSLVEVLGGLTEGEEVLIGMDAGKQMAGSPLPGETESSPFMPKPPGGGKKK